MRSFDYVLRSWRYRIAVPHVPQGCVLLDIGGHDGSFLQLLEERISRGVSIDPLGEERSSGKITCITQRLTDAIPLPDSSVDVVSMLAVFEHLGPQREALVAETARVLTPGGLAILTMPSPAVDPILKLLEVLRIVDADTLEEHQHISPADTVALFDRCGLCLVRRIRFQLGLNNLFIFEKRGIGGSRPVYSQQP